MSRDVPGFLILMTKIRRMARRWLPFQHTIARPLIFKKTTFKMHMSMNSMHRPEMEDIGYNFVSTPTPEMPRLQPTNIFMIYHSSTSPSQQLDLPPPPSPPNTLPPNNPNITHAHRNPNLLNPILRKQHNRNLSPKTAHKNNLLTLRPLHHTRSTNIIRQPAQLRREGAHERAAVVARQQRLVRVHERRLLF